MDAASIVVARALIDDELDLRAEPVSPVRLRVGESLKVRFAYRLDGDVPWAVSLHTVRGGDERVAKDGPSDEIWSEVEETYEFEDAGPTEIAFEARATRPRGRSRCIEGLIEVLVLP